MDKGFILRLVDAIEDLYLENMALKVMFTTYKSRMPSAEERDAVLAEAKRNPLIAGRIHEQFAPLRARILEDASLEQVLQEFLKVVPAKKEVN